jgi:hypothetical protein
MLKGKRKKAPKARAMRPEAMAKARSTRLGKPPRSGGLPTRGRRTQSPRQMNCSPS